MFSFKKEGHVCLRKRERERKKGREGGREGVEEREREKVGVDEIIFWVWMNQLFGRSIGGEFKVY